MYARIGKRVADMLLAGLAVIILSPVLAVTSLAIRLKDGSPVIYRQSRLGQNGQRFTILKFRSMPQGTSVAPSAGMDAAQVTKIGLLIRRSNIDELPQLFNILRGDMSVVGPRPPLDSQEVLIRLRAEGPASRLRPGLTGLAQVRAFDGMTESEKAAYDNQYARQVSLGTDLGIIARTFLYLLKPPPTY